MYTFKKLLAIAIIFTFLASVPLVIAQPKDNGVEQLILTIKAETYDAKPSGVNNAKPVAEYKLIYNNYKAEVPLDIVVYTTNSFGLSSDFVYSAIFEAANAWDLATSKQLINSITVNAGSGSVVYNDINAVFFGDYADSNVIAVASIWSNRFTRQIVECDIQFNTDYTWGDATVDSAVMDLQNIATHELGHGFNLADIYDASKSYLTMYGYSGYGDVEKRTLAAGDIAGIQKIYGA
jgi:hypothetical protein